MKRKAFCRVLCAVLVLLLAVSALVACNKKAYTLTLKLDDEVIKQVEKKAGDDVDPTEEGRTEFVSDADFDFYIVGWSKEPDGEAEKLPTVIDSDMTLYAKKAVLVDVRVYLQPSDFSADKQNYEFSESLSYKKYAEKGTTHDIAIEVGDDFALRTDGGDANAMLHILLDKKDNVVELYFDRTNFITVRYHANLDNAVADGSMSVDKVIDTGGEITLPENGFSAYGYRFAGWCENRLGYASVSKVYKPGEKINVTRNTILYAIWDEGYIDKRAGSEDVIFLPVAEDGVAILSRRGVGEVRGVVSSAANGTFATFNDNNQEEYLAKLFSDKSFNWKNDPMRADLFDMRSDSKVAGSKIDVNEFGEGTLTLTEDANVKALTIIGGRETLVNLSAGEYSGVLSYNDDEADYLFETDRGERVNLTFGRMKDSDETIFVTRGEEYGAYAERLEGQYIEGDILVLDGYGVAYREDEYFHLDWYGEYYFLNGDGLLYLFLENDTFESEAIIKIQTEVIGYANDVIPVRLFSYGDYYEYYDVRNASDGSTLFTDGFGNGVVTLDGAPISGAYEFVEEGLVYITDKNGGKRLFRLLLGGGFEEVASFEKAELVDPNSEAPSVYLYAYPNGAADIYSPGEDFFGFEGVYLTESGTYTKDGGKFFYTALDGTGFEYKKSNQKDDSDPDAIIYEIVRRFLTGTYSSSDGTLLFDSSGSATYAPSNGAAISGAYTYDGGNEAVITSGGKEYHFTLDTEKKTFEYVSNPGEIYFTIDALKMEDVGEIELFSDGTAKLYVFAEDAVETEAPPELVATGTYDVVDAEKQIYAFTSPNSEFNMQFMFDEKLFGITVAIMKSDELFDGTYVGEGSLALTPFGFATFTDNENTKHDGLYTIVETDFTTEKVYRFECSAEHDVECDLTFCFTLSGTSYAEFDVTGGMPDGFHFTVKGEEYILVAKTVSGGNYPVYMRIGNSFVVVALVQQETIDQEKFIFRITVTDVTDGYEDKVLFDSVEYVFSDANRLDIFNEDWNGSFSVANGGRLSLDGLHSALYTNGSLSIEGNYTIDENAGVITVVTEAERTYYFDYVISNGVRTMTKRGDEYGAYYLYDLEQGGANAPVIILNGYGKLGVYKDFDDVKNGAEYVCEGSYSLDGDRVNANATVNGQMIEFTFTVLTLRLEDNTRVNGYVVYSGEQTVVQDGWTAYILDGYYSAVYVDEFGVSHAGTYYISDNTLHFIAPNGEERLITLKVD